MLVLLSADGRECQGESPVVQGRIVKHRIEPPLVNLVCNFEGRRDRGKSTHLKISGATVRIPTQLQ
jgi:hypothetical protein